MTRDKRMEIGALFQVLLTNQKVDRIAGETKKTWMGEQLTLETMLKSRWALNLLGAIPRAIWSSSVP